MNRQGAMMTEVKQAVDLYMHDQMEEGKAKLAEIVLPLEADIKRQAQEGVEDIQAMNDSTARRVQRATACMVGAAGCGFVLWSAIALYPHGIILGVTATIVSAFFATCVGFVAGWYVAKP